MATVAHMLDGIWFDGPKVSQEEYNYYVHLEKQKKSSTSSPATAQSSCVARQIAQARERIQQTLQGAETTSVDASGKLAKCENENTELRKLVDSLVHRMSALEARLGKLESKETESENASQDSPVAQTQQKPAAAEQESDDSDVDMFGSDDESETEEEKREKEERLAAYKAKKAKKPAVVAKSNIILDVKPWDDNTDMAELEKCVRSITTDGLIWGPSKLVAVAYGIRKLQIACVVEDDKVGTDYLEENITEFDDYVQSIDVVAFNKV